MKYEVVRARALVIGSGAAGLAAAVRLNASGVEDVIVCTESLGGGTSINTGSDKQTYYKLNFDGEEADSTRIMAADLASCGAVHGDIALAEAALSAPAFSFLVSLGVRFPHDRYGRFAGYRTDHDSRGRATSAGPYTSRDMCLRLIEETRRRGIKIRERLVASELLVNDGRAFGAIFVNTDAEAEAPFTVVIAPDVVFAVGGPGGLYGRSVYPSCHTGAIGLALLAGAKARNLPESQFGMASVKFRWNVSGSYMQVVPRIFSLDNEGREREFITEALGSPSAACSAIFQKGYHWPFSVGEVGRSSDIDILVYRETVLLGRKVFLDYTVNPAGYSFESLCTEAQEYLVKCGASEGATPAERLSAMNPAAIDLYRDHSIDICSEPLEIAVCAQHNNGGLAADKWWESENIRHLYPVGEVNGSHGIVRPGGAALNAGQAGAWRAAEAIASRECEEIGFDQAPFIEAAIEKLASAASGIRNWRSIRGAMLDRMDRAGGFIRSQEEVDAALAEAKDAYLAFKQSGEYRIAQSFTSLRQRLDLAEILRTRQLLFAQCAYLGAISEQIKRTGSRGGTLAVGKEGRPVKIGDYTLNVIKEKTATSGEVSTCVTDESGTTNVTFEKCRPVPCEEMWFENVWREYREGFGRERTE